MSGKSATFIITEKLLLISVYWDHRKVHSNRSISMHCTIVVFTSRLHFVVIMRGFESIQNSGLNKLEQILTNVTPPIGRCVPEINRIVCDWLQCSTLQKHVNITCVAIQSSNNKYTLELAVRWLSLTFLLLFMYYVYFIIKVMFASVCILSSLSLEFCYMHISIFLKPSWQPFFLHQATQGLINHATREIQTLQYSINKP